MRVPVRTALMCTVAAASLVVCCGASAFCGESGQTKLTASQRRTYERFLNLGRIREFPPTPWPRAYIYESRYYRVRTNTSRDVARYIGILMDSHVEAFKKVFRFRMTIPKTNIYAYRTRKEFEYYGGKLVGAIVGPNTGGFWTQKRGGTIVLPYLREGNLDPGKVLLHEASHQFLHRALNSDRIPTWLDEGLAVFFEESRYNPITKKLELAYVPRERLRWLQHEMKADRHVSLKELVGTPREAFTASHYGSAWSFIYWLMRSADKKEALRRQKALNQYLLDIRAGRTDHRRLFAYLGLSMEMIEGRWRDWVVELDPNKVRGGTYLPGDANANLLPGH